MTFRLEEGKVSIVSFLDRSGLEKRLATKDLDRNFDAFWNKIEPRLKLAILNSVVYLESAGVDGNKQSFKPGRGRVSEVATGGTERVFLGLNEGTAHILNFSDDAKGGNRRTQDRLMSKSIESLNALKEASRQKKRQAEKKANQGNK